VSLNPDTVVDTWLQLAKAKAAMHDPLQAMTGASTDDPVAAGRFASYNS
jgi:hypothetical protein